MSDIFFIEPKEVEISDQFGNSRVFVISKWNAWDGREIVAKHPLINGRMDDYKISEEVMQRVLLFCAAIDGNGNKIKLTNKTLVNNHVPTWEMLIGLEKACVEYNVFFSKPEKQ